MSFILKRGKVLPRTGSAHPLSIHRRCILVARSPVFRAMFQRDTAEAQNKEIEMTDVEPEVAEQMLSYFYDNKYLGFEFLVFYCFKASTNR